MLLTFPWVLLGLLATAIPVAIHLFELRRPKRVLFTNVGFIREVKLITARQRKIKHLLVLLARIGFVVFLVLMFAQPYIPARLQEQNKGGAVGVLVDTSPSMQAGSADEEPRFDKAVREARSLPSGYPTATQFVLATGTQKPVMATVYQQQIDKLTISGQSQQFRSVLSGFSASTYKTGEVFVFSDFQRSTFSPRDLAQLDSTKQVFLVPLADKATRNVFVDSVWLDDAFVRTDSDVMLHVRLRNGGNENIENCQVKLFVEGK